MTEKQLEVKVRAYLSGRGEWVKIPRTRFGVAGVSDLVGCFNGRFVAIELKRPTGSYGITAAQAHWQQKILRAGGVVGVARSVEDVEAILAKTYTS